MTIRCPVNVLYRLRDDPRIDVFHQLCWICATHTKVNFCGMGRHKRKSRRYWKNDDTSLIYESVSPDEGAITCQQGKIAASEIESKPTYPNENSANTRIFDKIGKMQLATILPYERNCFRPIQQRSADRSVPCSPRTNRCDEKIWQLAPFASPHWY
jgi:hypothetical protein